MKTNKTKAIIYCRVSSDRQVKEGHGLDSQEKRCRDYAKSAGYDVIKVFREEGESGGLFERTAMKQLISYLDEHNTHDNNQIVVIFDDIKRFARKTEVHFMLKAEIYGRNGRVESPNFRFEDTPDGIFVETVMAATAALERDQNRRQVMQKMKARLEMGYWAFMPPLGLINKKDAVHGKLLVPHEPYATIFKQAIEKYRDGILSTQNDVRLWLHEEFKRSGLPNRPSMSSVQEILKNPLFAGYIEYSKWDIPFMKAKHEGFISLETYKLVQVRLQGHSKPWKRRDYSVDFPLRPHVLCAACSRPLTASWNKGRSEKYPNYFCRGKDCTYKWKTIRRSKLELEFEDLLNLSKPAEEVIDLTKYVLQDLWKARLESYTERKVIIASEVKEVDSLIDSYVNRIGKTDNENLIATYENKINELQKKKNLAVQRLDGRKYTSEQFGTASDKVFGVLKKPMSMWKSDDYDDKRTILFMYFKEQLKYDYERGFGTANLAYPVKLIHAVGQAKNGSVEMSGSEPECEKNFLKRLQACSIYIYSHCLFQLTGNTTYRLQVRVKSVTKLFTLYPIYFYAYTVPMREDVYKQALKLKQLVRKPFGHHQSLKVQQELHPFQPLGLQC